MPETLETIALSLRDLRTSIDGQFKRVDEQFERVDEQFKRVDEQFKRVDEHFKGVDDQFKRVDEQFKRVDERFERVDDQFEKADQKIDKVQSHLEIKIEAVQDTVNHVYDAVISHQQQFGANDEAHETFTKRLDAHDLRIVRLESRKATDRSPRLLIP